MKKFLLTAGMVLFSTIPVLGQDGAYPRGEVFAGFSYLDADLLFFRETGYGFNLNAVVNPHPNVGIEVDFSVHDFNFVGVDFQEYLFMAGPRVAGRFEKVTPFAHALFGLSHVRAVRSESESDFAMAFGVGLDVNVHENVAIRVIQADYVLVRVSQAGGQHTNSDNVRVSAGVVFKWGGS
jgi:opacity protein-like surface antigen